MAGLATRVLAATPELVQRLGDLFRTADSDYGALSDETLTNEVLPVTRSVIEKFFASLVKGRWPDAREVKGLEEMGRRRLEMGVSLESMLHIYRIGGRAVFEAACEAAQPGEERALGVIGSTWMDYLDRLSTRSASGYMLASHELVRRVEARRGALLQAMLAATDAVELAAVSTAFSITLAPEYSPVVVAGNDVMRRLDVLLTLCPADTLICARPSGVVMLCTTPPDHARLCDAASATTLVWGRAAPPGAELRIEVEHLERLLEIVLARGTPGVFGPDDLLLEQLVAESRRIENQLVRNVLRPLLEADHGGSLLSTLRSYLETGSIASTAQRGFAHPNSVAYRLRRVAALTGYDARVPSEAAVLAVALIALDQSDSRSGRAVASNSRSAAN